MNFSSCTPVAAIPPRQPDDAGMQVLEFVCQGPGAYPCAGWSVDTAVDGLGALSRLRGARYDVVSDIAMPNMDGPALAAGIRANPVTYFTKDCFDQDRLLATPRRVGGMEAQ